MFAFTYGRSYLERDDPLPLYGLPLVRGPQLPSVGEVAGAIADAAPDAWGRRVVEARLLSHGTAPEALTLPTYLLESGSDRPGALDFQTSATEYAPRQGPAATLSDLANAADLVDRGQPLPPSLDLALLHGSSLGGARPKAALTDSGRALIAKFGSARDTYPAVKGEYVAMRLATLVGLKVAPVELGTALGKDVLLVERFDRTPEAARRFMVSAVTVLGLDELGGRYASYADLADTIRAAFASPEETLHELFARITFNVLVGNSDDHAKNHAAFWDGEQLTLTPAYDIEPQPRSGEERQQAMAIGKDGFRRSQVAGCVRHAATYHLTEQEARDIVDRQLAVIADSWTTVCDDAGLTEIDRSRYWRRSVLNPYATYDY